MCEKDNDEPKAQQRTIGEIVHLLDITGWKMMYPSHKDDILNQ
jgi:hypothetical protein